MSNNALSVARNGQKTRRNVCIAHRRDAAGWEFAESCYSRNLSSGAGLNGLIARSYAETAAVNDDKRRRWELGTDRGYGSYQPNGLIALSNQGIKVFAEKHPGVLPHNLYKAGPSGQGHYSYNHHCSSHEQYEEVVGGHARFGGWMKAAADIPLVARAIKQSVSPRGTGSRRTYVDLWQLAAKYYTPHTLKRRIIAVQWRARQILAAYDGRGCSLRCVMTALAVTGSTGKAALIAAYRSLTGENARSYREAREALTRLHLCKVEDVRDGVSVYRTETPEHEKLGTQVFACVQKSSYGWKRGFLVLRGERSYHILPHLGYMEASKADSALRCALSAWKRQDAAAKEGADKYRYLLRSDVTILVTREDSYRAGNCRPGTETWIASTGVGRGRWCVPASALMHHTNDARVAKVLSAANSAAGVWLREHMLAA